MFQMIWWVVMLLAVAIEAQVASKTVIDFCSVKGQDCGTGVCEARATGNRCRCPSGWMGRGCKRPCQDVYKSCTRWKEEQRCSWTRPISPFFTDNCGYSCGTCEGNRRRLALALPPILDNIAWIVGRWESKTTAGDRFPEPLTGPYREIFDVQISEVPAFDRPPVNISVLAETFDGHDVRREVGFMTSKPFNEDTGFIDLDKPKQGDDQVAIETVGNSGLLIIEEGVVRGSTIRLDSKYKMSALGWKKPFVSARRMFLLLSPDVMEERVIQTDANGVTKKWLKRYQKTFDYLTDYVKE